MTDSSSSLDMPTMVVQTSLDLRAGSRLLERRRGECSTPSLNRLLRPSALRLRMLRGADLALARGSRLSSSSCCCCGNGGADDGRGSEWRPSSGRASAAETGNTGSLLGAGSCRGAAANEGYDSFGAGAEALPTAEEL